MKNAVKRPGRSGLRGLQKRRKLHEKNEEARGSFLCILYGCHGTGRLRQKETSQTAETGSAATTEKAAESGSGELIALITMDSIDQHWVTLNEGAQKAAKELGVTVQFMAPNTKDDAQQIECVNNAVSAGAKAIIVAANGPDAISLRSEGSSIVRRENCLC